MRRFLALGSFMALWDRIIENSGHIFNNGDEILSFVGQMKENQKEKHKKQFAPDGWCYRIVPSHPWVYLFDPQKNLRSIFPSLGDTSLIRLAVGVVRTSCKPLKVSSRWLQARSTRQQFQQFLLEADLVPGGRPLVSAHS